MSFSLEDTQMKRRPVITALIGGTVVASVAALALKRYFVFKNLKEEITSIPWDKEEVTWKHFFKKY